MRLSNDESVWLEESYKILKKGGEYIPEKIYAENFQKFSSDFFPEELRSDLVTFGGITLFSIWLIDSQSEFIEKSEKLIFELKKRIESFPVYSRIETQLLFKELGFSEVEGSKCLNMLYISLSGFIKSISGQNDIVFTFEINTSFSGIRKFKNFKSIHQEFVSLSKRIEKELSKPRIRTIKSDVRFANEDIRVKNIEKNTAFIIMQIDPSKPELDDVLVTIKDVFHNFGIDAVRADEIQHQDKITDIILNKIQTSEFIIADLTGERPNVYYEIGYAHSEGKRPILVRKKGAKLHFDLSIHNAPEYKNNSDLKEKLTSTLKSKLGREPKKGS